MRRAMFTAGLIGMAFVQAAMAADEGTGTESAGDIDLSFKLNAGVIALFDADIDDGGEVGTTLFGADLGASAPLNDTLKLGLDFRYEHAGYDFSGAAGFGGLDPWDDIHTVKFGASLTWQLNNDWSVFGGLGGQFSVESGGEWGDGFTGGGTIGATWSASDDLTIGGGLIITSQIEDSAAIYPILLLEWRLSDQWRLRSGHRITGLLGSAGLELEWTLTENLSLAFGGMYHNRRFRLDDEGPAVDGVGEDTGVPLYVRLAWHFSPKCSLSVLAGMETVRELRLEDEGGDQISEEDVDPSLMLGAVVAFEF